ncbi:MAG: ATP-binding protein [Pseudomonadota bacterium]
MTFITDQRGILLINFPFFVESIGKDLSNRDWYKGISTHWKPYISTVFKLIVGDKPLAVAVCVPIFDEKGIPIAILGDTQRLIFIDNAIERVPFSPYTTVNVIDRAGQILYSTNIPYRENITDYRFTPIIEAAIKEKKQQIEIIDPQKGHDKSYLTAVPIGDIGWTAIIERSERDIFRSEFRHFVELGAVAFLLFLLITFFLVYLRKASLYRKTEELLQAETKLRQRDEKLRTLSSRHEAILAAVPEIIMEVNNKKVYTWANSVGIEFFGEDVIGKEAAFFFEGEPDTYDKVSSLSNSSEETIYVENWQRRRDGEKRLLAWWCRMLKNEKGNVEGMLSSAHDFTDHKRAEDGLLRSEQLLKDTQSISKIGGWEYDIEKKLIIWTDEVYRIYGVERNFDPNDIGKAISFYCKEDQQIIEKAFLTAIHTGKPYDLELQFNAADGTKKWVRTMGNPVLKDDKITKVYGNINDITEHKQAEEALRRSEHALQEKNAELIRFSYAVSHDLKSPLITILTFLNYLEKDIRNQETARTALDLGYIRTAAEKMGRLLDELRDLSHIGRVKDDPVEMPLQEIVQEALALVAGRIAEKGVQVQVTETPVVVFGDRSRLVEVFQNLIDNAVKFTGDQTAPCITIGAEKSGDEIVLFVRDNGIGIDPLYHENIFGLFEKLDSRAEGTGMGLALVKRIVEVHGGGIRVESKGPGHGAYFRFTLAGTRM